MKRKGHLIQAVSEDGIACEMGIETFLTTSI